MDVFLCLWEVGLLKHALSVYFVCLFCMKAMIAHVAVDVTPAPWGSSGCSSGGRNKKWSCLCRHLPLFIQKTHPGPEDPRLQLFRSCCIGFQCKLASCLHAGEHLSQKSRGCEDKARHEWGWHKVRNERDLADHLPQSSLRFPCFLPVSCFLSLVSHQANQLSS